ncbi:hypothetical protein HYZ78_00145 [Candidatus Microgenomates bacterium]|nr:hypothetical protein [Candidatus Microgenomates bacterium]
MIEQSYGVILNREPNSVSLFLGGPTERENEFEEALVEIQELKKQIGDWPLLVEESLKVFRQHGFVLVEPLR